jgi:hypothetical protein
VPKVPHFQRQRRKVIYANPAEASEIAKKQFPTMPIVPALRTAADGHVAAKTRFFLLPYVTPTFQELQTTSKEEI